MQKLRELNEELGKPSQTKLLAAAKKAGLKVSRAQVEEVVKADSTRELFKQPQAQRGSHATNDEGAQWQADLVDLKQFESAANEDKKYILSVTNVFDRRTKTASLESKKPQEVWEAFEGILRKFGSKPSKLSVDNGEEWASAFAEGAEGRGIVVQNKLSDPNAVAISDAAVQSIKRTLFRDMAAKNSSKWVDKVDKAEKSYNKTPHENLMGEAPEDVSKQPVVRFRLMQDNAEKLRRNAKQLDQRQKRLEDLGAFRPMLGNQSFQRGFKPRFSGEVKPVDKIEGGVVISGGQRYEIARVQPVSKDSRAVSTPSTLASGSEARTAKQASELQEFRAPLNNFLRDAPKGMAAVGTFLRGQKGFEQKLTQLRLDRAGGMRLAIQAIDPSVQISGEGKKGQPTVQVKRRRLVGKQQSS